MKTLAQRLLIVGFALGFSTSAWAYDLSGLWTLKVENRRHRVVTTLTIKFTNQSVRSCMSGDWSKVSVLGTTTEDAHFYPMSGPLSFSIEDNRLSIGQTEICDAYVMLSGALNDKEIKGQYYDLNLGGTFPLGFFTLSQTK